MAFRGQQSPTDGGSEFNALCFLVQQLLGKANTASLVKVVAVTNTGDLSPVGFVDILPLVNQVDGNGNATPHGIIHNVPYLRIQGGANAVILDPQVGDIGPAVFADHDINSVKANRAQSNPGSGRRFAMADAMYFGGMLNGVPTQYVQFNTAGITLHSPTKINIEAPTIEIVGNVVGHGGAVFDDDVVADGISVSTHNHNVPNVQSGGSTIPTTDPLP